MARHDLNNIIKIGEELFRTKGYYNTGTEEILNKAKFPRSSFYHHFKNKEGFARKVLENYGRTTSEFYQSILKPNTQVNPKKRFETLFKVMVNLAKQKDFKSQCLVQKMSTECALNNSSLQEAANKELNNLLGVFENCIREGQDRGEFRTDIESQKLAQFLHSMLYGVYTIANLSRNVEDMQLSLNLALDYISK